MAARCTVRRGGAQDQSTNALGFRVAASAQRGYDAARVALDLAGVDYDPGQVLALDRWWALPTPADRPEGYGLVGGYEHMVFVPVEELTVTEDSELEVGPVPLGLLSTSLELTEPALEPGVYLLELAPMEVGFALRFLDARSGEDVGLIPCASEGFARDDGLEQMTVKDGVLHVEARVLTRIRRRVLPVGFDLRPVAGALDGEW